MKSIQSIAASDLTFFRTLHYFERYGEFFTIDDFTEYCNWANLSKTKVYILGNGSNTLFIRKNIKSLILKNKLHKYIEPLAENRLEVSSSVLVLDVLKYCYKNSFESFYYLASVPATVGGALAMNAGRGREHQQSIYDFVESVTFFDFENNCIKTLEKQEVVRGYRETMFTGVGSNLILSVIFKFDCVNLENNPIVERCKWSKEFQDYSAPNCGSVFKQADKRLLRLLKNLSIGKARFSAKTANWILNNSSNNIPIILLVTIAKLLHLLMGKKASLEIITVD